MAGGKGPHGPLGGPGKTILKFAPPPAPPSSGGSGTLTASFTSVPSTGTGGTALTIGYTASGPVWWTVSRNGTPNGVLTALAAGTSTFSYVPGAGMSLVFYLYPNAQGTGEPIATSSTVTTAAAASGGQPSATLYNSTISVINSTTSAISGTHVARFTEGFAPGEFPSGYSLVATRVSDGVNIPISWLNVSSRPDGSVEACAIKLEVPASLSAYGASGGADRQQIQIQAVAATSSNSDAGALTTMSAMAAQNFALRFISYDNDDAGITYWLYLSNIYAASNTGGRPAANSNATSYWEYTNQKAGTTEIRAEGFFSTSNTLVTTHAWLKGVFYITALASGGFHIDCRAKYTNTHGPLSGAGTGANGTTTAPTSIDGEFALFQGSTMLKSWGGQSDYRALNVVFSNNNQVTLPAGHGFATWSCQDYRDFTNQQFNGQWGDVGLRFAAGSGGTLPSGCSAGKIYRLRSDGDSNSGGSIFAGQTGTAEILDTPRGGSFNNAAFTSNGSGTIIMYPVVELCNHSTAHLFDNDAMPVKVGTAGDHLFVAHDQTHFLTQSRLVLPATPGIAAVDDTQPIPPYSIGTFPYYHDLGTQGDNPGDTRIGYHPQTAAWGFQILDSYPMFARTIIEACYFAKYPACWEDERTIGSPVVPIMGPDGTANTNFPGLGQSNPYFDGIDVNDATSPGNPGWRSDLMASAHNCEFTPRYEEITDGSHFPKPAAAAYIRTGRTVFMDQTAELGIALLLGSTYSNVQYPTFSTVTGGNLPAASVFPTVNVGNSNAAMAVSGGGTSPLVLTQPVQGGDEIAFAVQALSSGAYTYTAVVQANVADTAHSNVGITLHNPTTGACSNLLLELDTASVGLVLYSNQNTYSSGVSGGITFNGNAAALRITVDASGNVNAYASATGAASSFVACGSTTLSALGNPTQIGPYIDNFCVSGGNTGNVAVYEWDVSSGVNPQTATGATVTTQTFSRPFFSFDRIAGWSWAAMNHTDQLLADADPRKPIMRRQFNDLGNWALAAASSRPADLQRINLWGIWQDNVDNAAAQCPWMACYCIMALSMAVWRGFYPALQQACEEYLFSYNFDCVDQQVGGSTATASFNWYNVTDCNNWTGPADSSEGICCRPYTGGPAFPDQEGTWDFNADTHTFPSAGIVADYIPFTVDTSGSNSGWITWPFSTTSYALIQLGALGVAAQVGIARAARLYADLKARFDGYGPIQWDVSDGAQYYMYGFNSSNPVYAAAPSVAYVPPAATAVPAAPTLSFNYLYTDSIGLQFNRPGDDPSWTALLEVNQGGAGWTTYAAATIQNRIRVNGLVNGSRSVQLRVTCSNKFGTGPTSSVLSVTLPTPASAPTNLKITAAYAQALVIGWAGTGPFKVEQQGSGGTWTTIAPVWQSNTFMQWNLAVSTSYTFRISSADAGQGPGMSSTITASTTAVPGAANTVVNNGPYGYSLSVPSHTQTHGTDIGKCAISFTKSGSAFDPPNPRFAFSPSQYDPSIGNPALQGWTEYGTGSWYDNDVDVPSTAGTYYLWIMTEDGYSYLDPGNPWTIT